MERGDSSWPTWGFPTPCAAPPPTRQCGRVSRHLLGVLMLLKESCPSGWKRLLGPRLGAGRGTGCVHLHTCVYRYVCVYRPMGVQVCTHACVCKSGGYTSAYVRISACEYIATSVCAGGCEVNGRAQAGVLKLESQVEEGGEGGRTKPTWSEGNGPGRKRKSEARKQGLGDLPCCRGGGKGLGAWRVQAPVGVGPQPPAASPSLRPALLSRQP